MDEPDKIEYSHNHWDGLEWIALYTQPRAEKQAAKNLQREGFECYLPLVKERHQWSDRMQWVEVPLLSSYIFARIQDIDLVRVRNVDGIVCAVTFGATRTVARIPDQQMEDFKDMVSKAKAVRVIQAGEFHKGVLVEVVAGDFKGKRGRLVTIEGEDLFGIMLEGVSIAIATIMDAKLLKVVPPAEKKKKQPKP